MQLAGEAGRTSKIGSDIIAMAGAAPDSSATLLMSVVNVKRENLALTQTGELLQDRMIEMLFKKRVLDRIKTRDVTLAFRRWTRPTVRSGGSLRTAIGVLAIDNVVAVEPKDISGEEARRAGYVSRGALLADLGDGDGRFYRIEFHLAGPDPREILRQDDHLGVEELSELQDRLAALDQKSRAGPWTVKALRMIAEQDGRTAGEIAANLGIEMPALKRKIGQLKELGLTESLQSGYGLSKRGQMVHSKL
ncbi:MAG: hypothetical protein K0S56_1877 [Microvirga sp.]|jgi:DNA-binding transcriptional ArsR family regulator|nr:hypothetical protein [Microvirga sp.]